MRVIHWLVPRNQIRLAKEKSIVQEGLAPHIAPRVRSCQRPSLGAAYPGSGDTYHYLREILRGSAWGRFLPFLFIWQFLVSGTLELASGYIAASKF
jgi:hypothetical protein